MCSPAVLIQVPSWSVFKNDSEVCGCQERLLEKHNVRMTQTAVCHQFPAEIVLIFDLAGRCVLSTNCIGLRTVSVQSMLRAMTFGIRKGHVLHKMLVKAACRELNSHKRSDFIMYPEFGWREAADGQFRQSSIENWTTIEREVT